MRLTDEAPNANQRDKPEQRSPNRPNTPKAPRAQEEKKVTPTNNAMAAAFGKLKK